MRKLIIMRGPQGSGKSAILRAAGLAANTLSMDALRLALTSPVLNEDGDLIVNQEHNIAVWEVTMQSMSRRLKDGETFAIDATLPRTAEVEELVQRARAQRYDVLVVDRYGMDPEKAWANNAARPTMTRVPRRDFDRVQRTYATTRPFEIEVDVVSTGDDLDASVEAVREFLRRGTETVDLSGYDRVCHIGDLQGCLQPLLEDGAPTSRGLDDPTTFFVFHGDLLDRGIENAEVARWYLDNAVGRDNVACIAGNHEDHIELEADGRAPVSREFEARTLPQLRAGGITRDELKLIADSTVPLLDYVWRGTRVLASHGGFSKRPDPLWALSIAQLRKGNGNHGTTVDRQWTEWSLGEDGDGSWQVHGHRNPAMLPVIPDARSISLEGQAEFGGHVRFAVLDESGWTPIEIRCTVHKTMQEFRRIDDADRRQQIGRITPVTPWAKRGDLLEPIPAEELASFVDHPMVNVSWSQNLPHVASLNFSKKAFWDKAWDGVTMRTRGLFVDMERRTIVSRAFEKFFNLGENEATTLDAVRARIAFPAYIFDKTNGFLCTVGYDERTSALVVTSKSRTEERFADWARTILRDVVGDDGMERLLRLCRDQAASCVFEIIDPVNDPHIIEEAAPRAILLDVVRRAITFEHVPYEDLAAFGKYIGCETKRSLGRVDNWMALEKRVDRIQNDPAWTPTRSDGPSEGVVVEDASGYFFKVKSHFYSHWKSMRGAKDRILSSRRKGSTFDALRYEGDEPAMAFIAYCHRQSDETLDLDIITLRNLYLADPDAVTAPPMQEPEPDHSGFLRGVEAIAAQIDVGRCKPQTARRMIQRAEEDPGRLAAFDAHPAASALRAFVAQAEAAA